jgi:hypothetical protein
MITKARATKVKIKFYQNQKILCSPGVLVHTHNPSIQEAEAGGSQFKASPGYAVKP